MSSGAFVSSQFRSRILFAILTISLGALGVSAGEEPPPHPEKVPEIVVEAKREKPPTALPSPTTSATPVNEQGNGITLTNKEVRYSTAETVRDALSGIPGVVVPGFGVRHIPFSSIRGHVNINFGDPNAPLVLDGVAWADWRATNTTLFDVDTIRVERGTQRSAGGRAAIAGAFIVESNAPTPEITALAKTEIGNYGHQIYEAAVSGPIVREKLLFRIAAQKAMRDGYQRNRFDGERPDYRDTFSIRGELQYTPIKDLDIRFQSYGSFANDGAPTLDSRGGTDGDIFKVDTDTRGHVNVDRDKFALKVRYTMPLFTLFSNTARQHYSIDNDRADYDFSPVHAVDLANEKTSDQWSQELRLESHEDATIRWRAGAYFEDYRTYEDAFLELNDPALLQSLGFPAGATVRDRRQAIGSSYTGAVFGDFTYKFDGGFAIEPGLRVEHRRESIHRDTDLFQLGAGAPIQTGPDYSAHRSTTVALPSLKLIYDSAKNWSVYALGSGGYRPGGFSHLATEPVVSRYQNEYMWTGEIGTNGQWLKGKLEASAALFYSVVDDYQVRRESTVTNIRIDNADQAWMRGAELELTGRPLKGLELDARLSLLRAEYDRFEDRVTGERFDGQRIPYAASYQFLLRARYEHSTGFFSQVDYTGRGRHRMRDERPVYQTPYEELGARIGYEHKHVSVFLYGNNLTDRRSASLLFALAGDGTYVESPATPRTFGISVTFKY